MSTVAEAATAAAGLRDATPASVAAAVTTHLAAQQATPTVSVVNAVSLKLADFNPGRAEYWFVATEAEFRIKNITEDLTKFSYVIASMKGDTIDHVIRLVRDPPVANAYKALKDKLLLAFGRTDLERGNALLDWPGMGDSKPLAMLDKMLATLPAGSDENHVLFKTLFVRQLPPDVRDHLTDKMALPVLEIATAADRFFALTGSRQNQATNMLATVGYTDYLSGANLAIDNVSQRRSGGRKQTPNAFHPQQQQKQQANLCFYHARYGMDARKCKKTRSDNICSMAHLPLAPQPAGNTNCGTMELWKMRYLEKLAKPGSYAHHLIKSNLKLFQADLQADQGKFQIFADIVIIRPHF
jgi:hypothetical protein